MGSKLKPLHDRVVVKPKIQKATPSGRSNYGFDVLREQYVDLVQAAAMY
jgi:co-chaperonin GroES (HSP10)